MAPLRPLPVAPQYGDVHRTPLVARPAMANPNGWTGRFFAVRPKEHFAVFARLNRRFIVCSLPPIDAKGKKITQMAPIEDQSVLISN